MKLTLSIFSFLLIFSLFAQSKKIEMASIADCEGAINIFKAGNYSIQFTGNAGAKNEFSNYPSLISVSDLNTAWVSFIPEYDGILSFDASVSQNFLKMVVFIEDKNDVCHDLAKGIAEIKRLQKDENLKKIGLQEEIKSGYLYPLKVNTGQKIVIGFSTLEKAKSILQLDLTFTVVNENLKAENETKIIDLRKDEFAPSLSIHIRDAETKEPIIANLSIEGLKDLAALYKGSEFYFNPMRSGKAFIKCDAEGYFFIDQEEVISATSNQEINIYLEPLSKGKSMQIEEIEFKSGTSEFMEGSEPKLRRLRDFMALNSDVSVEIQGHVFATGDNSIAAQKISEARAKRVMQYLITQGIDKSRMTAIGYGNTKPVYANPKFAYEEQANRRVEIQVK
jgi:outer membrane protein OmpA-like peptidoglycan-associated protein